MLAAVTGAMAQNAVDSTTIKRADIIKRYALNCNTNDSVYKMLKAEGFGNPALRAGGVREWKKDLDDGGYIKVTQYRDVTLRREKYHRCTECNGTKKCPSCRGTKRCILCGGTGIAMNSPKNDRRPCVRCNGRRICSSCNATGLCACIRSGGSVYVADEIVETKPDGTVKHIK